MNTRARKVAPKANRRPERHPHHVLRRASAAGIEEVLVAFSGGKDALVTLDLCSKHFKRVEAYFMAIVPQIQGKQIRALPHEEKQLQWAERRWGLDIHRVPHPWLSRLIRDATFRHATNQSLNCWQIKAADLDAYLRKKTGIEWIAAGERAQDSLERNAYIRETGGIDRLDDDEQQQRDAEYESKKGQAKKKISPRRRLYPIGFWSDSDVLSYLARNRIPTPAVYQLADQDHFNRRGKRREFGGLQMDTVAYMKDHMPEDYAAIKRMFPLIEAQVVRWKALCKEGEAR